MEYRNLGNSGLQVSAVGLGCNNIGRQVDEAGTVAIVNKCLDLGITFFDSADVYGGDNGRSEALLGKALKAHRRDVVIATKVGAHMGEGPYRSGASRRYIMDAVDDSLRRLDSDYIDLLQLHFPDRRGTPIEETMRALDDIVRAGKARYIGAGTFSGWQIVEAAWVAKSEHLTPFISCQHRYNVLERGIEKEFIPACRKYGIGLLPYYPLAAGFLTGKYRPGEAPAEGTRLATGLRYYEGILSEKNFESLVKLEDFVAERGHTTLELAMGWLASQPVVSCVATGATRPEQIEENVKAATSWRLSEEDLAEVDRIIGVG